MSDFLIKKNALSFKIFPIILVEVTIYIIFLAIIFAQLRDDAVSKAMVILATTVPVLSFFYLSAIRTGLLELNICRHIKYDRLVPVTLKTALFLCVLGVIAFILTLVIWYPAITFLIPGFDLAALLTESVNDALQHGLGLINMHVDLLDEQLVYGTLLPVFITIFLLLQTLFTIPMASLAASMDGKTEFDPITGIGAYFWSMLLTLSVGYVILAILLINIVLGTSIIFEIPLSLKAIINDHDVIFIGGMIFMIIIFPISYLAALHASVSAKAYRRYINQVNEVRTAIIGARIKPKAGLQTKDADELETSDLTALRKMRQRRQY